MLFFHVIFIFLVLFVPKGQENVTELQFCSVTIVAVER